ncbi:MAG: FHA domain-containing protein [Eubacteriales bacterium]|nr:FHA domain-containing protein [Eubacteriales bacterium]
MSIMSQIAVIVLILLTGMILIYANKGLENAALEGEKFVDEWAIRQMKKEEKEKERSMRKFQRNSSRNLLADEEAYDVFNEEEGNSEEFSAYEEEKGFHEFDNNQLVDHAPRRKELSIDQRIHLILLDEGKKQTRSIEIDHSPYSIGRDSQNDLSLNDLYVAKFHCQVLEENGNFVLKDLGTANKIFADGNMVSRFILKDKDHFYIGGCEFMVKADHHRSQPTILAAKAERV